MARHAFPRPAHPAHRSFSRSTVRGGSVVAAPVANLSDYRVLRDNAGDSLKDITVSPRSPPTAASPLPPQPSRHCTVSLPLQVWSSERQRPALAAGNPCARANGGCAQLCLWDGARARCACPHGDIAPDQRNCTRLYPSLCRRLASASRLVLIDFPSAAYASFLMYSRVTKIDSIHMSDEKNLNSPYPPIQSQELMRNAISLAYEYGARRLFYSDIQRGAINSVRFDGSDHRVLLDRTYFALPGPADGTMRHACSGINYRINRH